MARKLIKSETIEIVIPNGATNVKFQFPDNPNLRNVHLWGIEAWSNVEVPISIQSQNPLIGITLMQSIFVTLQSYNGKNFSWQKPLMAYKNQFYSVTLPAAANMFVSWYPIQFCGQKVNFPKSYIEIANAALIPPAPGKTVVLLDIYYSEKAEIEKKDKKASFLKQS